MKHAAGALAVLIARIASTVGIEGAFLVAGTALLAIGAGYLSPAGPWLVTGLVAIGICIAVSLPEPPKPERPG